MNSNAKDMNYYSFKKLIVFGDEFVGKSSLVKRLKGENITKDIQNSSETYTNECIRFISEENTIPLFFNVLTIKLSEETVEPSLLKAILYNCECAIFLFDIITPESLIKIKSLLKQLDTLSLPLLTKLLIANKSDYDSKRVISNLEIQEVVSNTPSLLFHEISLLTMHNVLEMYNDIKDIYLTKNKDLPNKYIYETDKLIPITSKEIQETYKIVLLGDSIVGKTSFFNRYFEHVFREEFMATIGINKENKTIKVFDELNSIQIWDTAGQERYRSLPSKYYTNADGILLMFDLSNKKSFSNVAVWMKEINDNGVRSYNNNNEGDKGIAIYLIGNKIDIPEREIDYDKAEEFAKGYNIPYFEISCKWNLNINEAIHDLVFNIVKRINHKDSNASLIDLKTSLKPKTDKKCCQ